MSTDSMQRLAAEMRELIASARQLAKLHRHFRRQWTSNDTLADARLQAALRPFKETK